MSAEVAVAAPRAGRSFAALFAVTFCGLLAVGAVLPVLPRYVHGTLGYGDVTVGIVIGAYAVTGLLLRPFAGRLADRRGRKPTLLLGVLVLACGGLLYLPELGLAGVILARLATGAGEGTLYTAGSAWIVDMAPVARRGRILGLYGLAVWGGFSVGPLAGELLLDLGGYTAVWIFAAAMPLLGALVAAQVPDPFVPHPNAAPHPLIAPEATGPGLAVALAAVGYAAVASFVILHLEDRGVGHGVLVFGALAVTVVITRLVAGDLPDRAGAIRVAIIASLVEAAGLVMIGLAESLPVALLGGFAMGAGFSLLNPSLMLIALGRVTPASRGAAMGTFTAFFDAGVGLGAPLAGAAAALSGYQGAFLFAATLAAASALLSLTRLRGPHLAPGAP